MSIASRLLKLVEYQNAIKQKIEEKGGEVSSNATLADIPEALDSIKGGGEDLFAVQGFYIQWNPKVNWGMNCGSAQRIPDNLFTGSPVTSVYGENIKEVGISAFAGCTTLATVNLPACTYVDFNAFSNCTSLIEVNLPQCPSIGMNAFTACYSLTTINIPMCKNIKYSTFRYCTNLSTINLPVCTEIGPSAFYSCARLSKIYAPICSLVSESAFDLCNVLEDVNLEGCQTIGKDAFYRCYKLQRLSLPACSRVFQWGFEECRSLVSLYLLGPSVATLDNKDAFDLTPIAGVTTYTDGQLGSIFVRASLLDQWKTATNWVAYSDRFVGLTDEEIAALED